MTVETPLLRSLRRSSLGAWLAVAHALAILASGLAPSPASAYAQIDRAVLCSGLPTPGPEAPEPLGEFTHCKGCPINPVLAGPGQAVPFTVARVSVDAVAETILAVADAPPAVLGLPPSRAPPAFIRQQL